MDENLLGYLLGSLDLKTERETEDYLRDRPEARARLELLKQVLEPLAADRVDPEPPANLWLGTLARISEFKCRTLPAAPPLAPPRKIGISRSRWRMADAVVAAAILLCVFGLGLAGLNKARAHYQVMACQNNLNNIHSALLTYCDAHAGAFPKVEDRPPSNWAGVYALELHDTGVPNAFSTACPANGKHAPSPLSVHDMQELWRTQPQEYSRCVRSIGGCYAYSLGFRVPGPDGKEELCGLQYEPGNGLLPIMADKPPFSNDSADLRNSLNHGGNGQNVLYVDGHAKFYTLRTAGVGGDDIFVNRRNRVAAGLDPSDTVLGASPARPCPSEDE